MRTSRGMTGTCIGRHSRDFASAILDVRTTKCSAANEWRGLEPLGRSQRLTRLATPSSVESPSQARRDLARPRHWDRVGIGILRHRVLRGRQGRTQFATVNPSASVVWPPTGIASRLVLVLVGALARHCARALLATPRPLARRRPHGHRLRKHPRSHSSAPAGGALRTRSGELRRPPTSFGFCCWPRG